MSSLRLSFHRFAVPLPLEQYDELHDDYEERYQIIGMVNEILFVVVTYPAEDKVRIISARKANARERRMYYGNRYQNNGGN